MNYYCFVAGAKDLMIDTPKGTPSMDELLDEYTYILSKNDAKLLRILRLSYDNSNLLLIIKDKDADINPLGNISKETWEQALPFMGDSESTYIYKEYGIEKYLTEFYQMMMNEESADKIPFPENLLAALYYKHAEKTNNNFLNQWNTFNLNLKNVISALICKKNQYNVNDNIVGENEITESILNNFASKDLGLNGIYDEIDSINSIIENSSLIDIERKIDALKWNWLEENTFFNHFSIEKLLSYWIKCEIIHRWDLVSTEEGTRVFKNILADLKKDIKF